MGDIALPNINYERELNFEKSKLQDEVEQYKQEVLEGLQIEEEGLTAFIRKKTKQSSTLAAQRNYNDPVDINTDTEETLKKNQKINIKSNIYKTEEAKNENVTKKNDFKKKSITERQNIEIKDDVEVAMLIETTTVKARHNRKNGGEKKKGSRNRRGRKRQRRKNKINHKNG